MQTYLYNNKEMTAREIKGLNPNISYREPTQLGAVAILPTPKPECGELEVVVRNGVTTDALGNTVEAWRIKPMFENDVTLDDGTIKTVVEQETEYLANKQAKEQEATINNVTNSIDNFIQSKLDEYNKANGTMFKDINAIAKYIIDTTYTHYPFCNAILNWNIQVWETARGIQAEVLAGTRELPNDIVAELPELFIEGAKV